MIITLAFLILATLWDLKTRRIPNFLTLPTTFLGLAMNAYYAGLGGIKDSLLGLFLGVVLLILPFALGGMGAGDVKLLAAVGALNGPSFVLYTFLYGAIAGGILAVFYALLRGQFSRVIANFKTSFLGIALKVRAKGSPVMVTSGLKFPYGIAFLIGSVITYWVR